MSSFNHTGSDLVDSVIYGFSGSKYTEPDPHPWTSDLRAMSRMLNNEIELPHLLDAEDENKTPIWLSNCNECLSALELRQRYLLSKEK